MQVLTNLHKDHKKHPHKLKSTLSHIHQIQIKHGWRDESRKQGSNERERESKPRAQIIGMEPAALTSEGRWVFIPRAQICPLECNKRDFRNFRNNFQNFRKFQIWEKSKSTPIFGTSENTSESTSENFQKASVYFRNFQKSFSELRFCVFSELLKMIFGTSENFQNARTRFCVFSELPKISRTLQKRNASKKNWFWAHTSLLICLYIIPLNSTAFLRHNARKKIQYTIWSLPHCIAMSHSRDMHCITTCWGLNNLHICLNKNVSPL